MSSSKKDSAAGAPSSTALAEDTAAYGIKRIPVDYYHVGTYRYTNLEDAIAEAKRAGRG